MCSTNSKGSAEPVAIVGMGCRFAGGVRDASGLWELLRNNREGWREFSRPNFSLKTLLHDNPDRPGSLTTRGAFLLDEDARLFDHSFFGITAREVETMDPSQRKILEIVYEAFENAGETFESVAGSRTGVYVGNFGFDHHLTQSRDWETPRPYAATGVSNAILANRVSYVFNLLGPSVTMDTACSSSMYALHMAVSAIRSGDCDGAIVAAGNWIFDPTMQMMLDKLGALSPTSRCHTFDAAADGYARGEGYAALYLKKSDIAILDGLPIRAMIRGTAINANGRTGGITRPSALGQAAVIRKAYENAGNLPFADTHVFECHGTGTPAGDPLEVAAVGDVFASSRRSDAAEDRMLIGSIKPNLGHTEGASAIASIIKVVMSLEAGEIAPTYGVQKLNPNIDFEGAKVEVVTGLPRPWPKGKLRRISVNSFGFGGANGHAIIDHVTNVLPGYVKPGIVTRLSQHPATNGQTNGHTNGHSATNATNGFTNGNGAGTTPRSKDRHFPITQAPIKNARADASTHQLVLLPFSAHNDTSLKSNIQSFSKVAARWPLADIAYTLGCRRSRFGERSFRIVDKDNLVPGLASEERIFTSPLQTATVGFVFTGQGAQWHAMGAQLFDYGVFRDSIAYLDRVLAALSGTRPSWTPSAVLSGACEPDLIQTPEVSQVACTAVQIGLVDLLASWSVRPAAVVGHSSGEMAAAYASGRVTAAEAITAAFFRGQAVSRNSQDGAMLAVALTIEQASAYLAGKEEQIQIGAVNSPGSLTLSGDVSAIETLAAELTDEGVFNRVLRTGGNAYHSHHMAALGSNYNDMLTTGIQRIRKLGLADRSQRYASVLWVSSVKPNKVVPVDHIPISYWRANLESPVQFSQAVTRMLEVQPSVDVLVEIGPHSALKGPLDEITKAIGKPVHYTSALKRNEDCRVCILQLAGTLFGLNADIDMAAVNAVDEETTNGDNTRSLAHGCTAVDLPIYQYTYGPVVYHENRVSKELRLREFPRHDLLGSRVPGAGKLQPQWRNVLRVKDLPWLADHRLIPDVVLPAAGYIAMAIEAASQVHRGSQSADTDTVAGYALRNVDIKTALRIPEDDYGVEVVFSMEPVDSSTQAPSWAKFAISSVSKDLAEWTEHCTGLVKVDTQQQPRERKAMTAQMDARTPDLASWYSKFSDIGLGYGPTFRPLSKLETDPHRHCAKAYVDLMSTRGSVKGGESCYHALHPAALDATFQLGIIACYGGQVDKASASFVPVHLTGIYLKARVDGGKQEGEEHGRAVAYGRKEGLRSAKVELQMTDHSGHVVLDVESLRLTQFAKSTSAAKGPISKTPFSSPFTRLVWQPDIRTLTKAQAHELFPPSEDTTLALQLQNEELICCLIVADIYDKYLRDGEGPRPEGEELRHWISWARRCVEHDQRDAMVQVRQLSAPERHELLEKLYSKTGHTCVARAARLLHADIDDILHERKTGIDVLVAEEGLLTELYKSGTAVAGAWPQLEKVLDCLGHVNPNQRILEIGAGTGSGTRVAMKALVGQNRTKRYADYTFTDISAGFLTSAREFMADYSDIHFSVLNIEEDPTENGYEPESYDVVLAVESIHATTRMDKTLAYCRSLLKPGGRLVLVESTETKVLACLVFGSLTGFWAGADDDRSEGPFMDEQKWDSRLRESGFSGTDIVLYDYPRPHNVTSVVVSTRVEEAQEPDAAAPTVVQLVHDGGDPPAILTQVAAELQRRRAKPVVSRVDTAMNTVPAKAHVVAFLSPKDSFCTNEHRLKTFQHLAQNVDSMVWVTYGGAVKGHDPRSAFMTGLLRAIATENPAGRFLSIDVDADTDELKDLVRGIVHLATSLRNSDWSQGNHRDTEYSWQDGCMCVSRLVPDADLAVYAEPDKAPQRVGSQLLPIGSQGPVRAAFETPGLLASLYFRPYAELLRPLPADYIDVKAAAVGLNWKDLSLTSGRFDSAAKHLSSEYAGVVTRTGAGVSGLAVGDRVYGMGRGHFGTYTRVPAAWAHKMRPEDAFEQVATMPVVYMSAVYALDRLVHLRRGQTVLIQSAAGGMGLAAVQIARCRGAEIFVTASGAEKVAFLTDTMGIPAERILRSRDAAALSRAAELLGKGGFDVILSTAQQADQLSDNLRALASGGHLLDMSRMDVLEAKTLGLELFQKNASFHSFDLNIVLDNDPELGTDLLETVDKLFRAGKITPIPCFSVTDISELDQTMQSFSKGTHFGKLVVSFQNPDSIVKMVTQPAQARFDPGARYVVTGGLGGLGRSIIRWMADRGAHDFIILSRRGVSTPEAQLLVDDLTSRGVRIENVSCDVSHKAEVIAAFNKAKSAGRPIKGVVHAAFSLSDLSFEKISLNKWQTGIAAKTAGTINLHEATASLPLDFFVMTTTTETIWAPATQAAYIAASNFQESFARYRRRLGLPASTVAYGLVRDVASDFKRGAVGTEDMMVRMMAQTTTEWQVLAALEPAFLAPSSPPSSSWFGLEHDPLSASGVFTCLDPVVLADMNPPAVTPRWFSDPRASLVMRTVDDVRRYRASDTGVGGGGDRPEVSSAARLRQAFDEAVKAGVEKRESAVELVTEGIVRTVADMLFMDVRNVNPAKSVADHGVDSLIAAELRHWFLEALATNLKMLDLLDARTSIRGLAGSIVDKALQR